MEIATYVCGSCAVASISNIGSHKAPDEVLRAFCKHELGTKSGFARKYNKLTSWYVFCAGPEVKSEEEGGSGHSKNHWPKYATETAEYIIANNLGKIATLGQRLNLRHHPKTTCQVWLWGPDQEALEAWWDKEQGIPAAVPVAPVAVPPVLPNVVNVLTAQVGGFTPTMKFDKRPRKRPAKKPAPPLIIPIPEPDYDEDGDPLDFWDDYENDNDDY